MASALLQAKSSTQLLAEEKTRDHAREQDRMLEQITTSLAGHLRNSFWRNRRAKLEVTERLLKCLRQRNGVYDPDILAEIRKQGGSEIYMMLTATKCRAAAAWIRDIVLPVGDKAWGVEPTAMPDVPPEIMVKVVQAAQKQAMQAVEQAKAQGQQVDPRQIFAEMRDSLSEKIKKAAEERANKANDAMEAKIEDQLEEGGWHDAMETFIEDFSTYPTAFLKGPITRRRKSFEWGPNFQPLPEWKEREEFEPVSPFDMYPARGAKTLNDGDLFEHVRFSRGQLWSMIGMEGYDAAAIRSVLRDYGRHGLRDWLFGEQQRRELEDDSYIYDNDGQIEGIHYWGSVQGLMLLEWGMDPAIISDPMAEYQVQAIQIGNFTIFVDLNDDPIGNRPYSSASFQNNPGSIWGTAIPELMADILRMCNATARALANNMGISSGPQVMINVSRLADGESITEMYPWKEWQTKDSASGDNSAPIQFFQPRSNASELLTVYSQFEQRADDATNIPRYAYGNEHTGGAGQTASGLSMLMNSATKAIKAAIGHIDAGPIKQSIYRLWYRNMVYDPDPSIKGDANIVARGTSALLIKDQHAHQLLNALAITNNPTDMSIIGLEGRADMLREAFRASQLPESVIPDDATIKEQMKASQSQPNPDMVKAQADMSEHQRKDKALMLEEQRKRMELAQEAFEKERDRYKDVVIAQMHYEGKDTSWTPSGPAPSQPPIEQPTQQQAPVNAPT